MKKLFVCICIFTLFCQSISAYTFQNDSNKEAVYADKNEIYSLKQMYIDLLGVEKDATKEYTPVSTNTYWWPIGSKETKSSNGKLFATDEPEDTIITSYFGYRGSITDASGRQITSSGDHGAIDIANYTGIGSTNVIAAKDGVVVFPGANDNISCVQGYNGCNGGYGNYVIIQHSDGNYTLYAHLATDSISVRAGENVLQGQVIAKIGSTGNSTGPHLHFEVRVGENNGVSRDDPLKYVDKDNPRSATASSTSVIDYINTFEGVGCWGQLSEEGDNYVSCVGVDAVTTIGHGVVWEFNKDKFEKYGYYDVSAGTRVPKSVVDKIQAEIIEENFGNGVRRALAEYGIDDLKDYQIDALISRAYNCGLGSVDYGTNYSFIPAYLKYNGHYSADEMTHRMDGIWLDAMAYPIYSNGSMLSGLQRRRASEWLWFTTGEVNFLDEFDSNGYVWY